MSIYSIIHNSGSMYLNLQGTGAATPHRNVNIYSSTASNDQKWNISSLTGTQIIYSQRNTAYGLNYYRPNANCDIQIVSGNETDAEVNFLPQSDGTYKIKLAHHTGLFLTAEYVNLNSNVSWKSLRSDNSQNWVIRPVSSISPTNHSYSSGTYSSKSLKIIETSASNIKLLNLLQQSSLKNAPYYGINGGWFNIGTDTTTLNIAISDGNVVGPDSIDGLQNCYLGSGVIFWNGSSFDIRPTTPGTTYYDGSEFLGKQFGTWAQGGYSMYLGLSNWYEKLKAENWGNEPPFFTSNSSRTGLVVNTRTKKVYLINCSTAATFKTFRAAIMARFGIQDGNTLNSTYKGIFLDGGGSSQLKARQYTGVEVNVTGDSRSLCQIIALRNNF